MAQDVARDPVDRDAPVTVEDAGPAAGTLDPPLSSEPEVTEPTFAPGAQETGSVASDAAERRALIIGEALIDVVHRADGEVSEHPGGSPANVAIGLGRLGRGVDLLTWFGKDAHGRMITDHLEASAVTVVPGSDSAARTSIAEARLGADGAATYYFDLSWEVPAQWVSPAPAPLVVHTGSIAGVLEPGAPDVANILAAHRASATITYDPNLRPSLMPPPEVTAPVVEDLLALADVVKVSDEDITWLLPGQDPIEVARAWASQGPSLVVVTRGGEGATAVTATGLRVDVAAPKVSVADTVGAGDSFMGGLIDGLWTADLLGAHRRATLGRIDEATVRRILERCARIAAITVGRPGADPPTTAEVDRAS